jgi:excisionase family DNA binding protein
MRPVLPPDLPPHAFLTLEEAASLLNVKLRWMRDAVEDERIRHYKIRRLVRIQAVDLVEFIASCRVEPDVRLGPRAGRQPSAQPTVDRGSRRPSRAGSGPEEQAAVVPLPETGYPRPRPVA